MDQKHKDNLLKSGQPARLIPSVTASRKEEGVTSALLACFRVIPEFARQILSEVGAPISKTTQISCYTEVVFNKNHDKKEFRPDGLIILKRGSKLWTAIVESKIGNAEHSKDQVEGYLDLAKDNNVNALITISNQYATLPTHHPVDVNKNKLRSTDLFHFSWLSIQTSASLLAENKVVTDPEQAFILSEFLRYLHHDESGVTSFDNMGQGWKEVSVNIHKGVNAKKSDSITEEAIASWQQFTKYLSIRLSSYVGQPVHEYITRSRSNDPEKYYSDHLDNLTSKNVLSSEFDIPNAASRLMVTADFMRRTINISMTLDAPEDRKYPYSAISWLTRQISDLENEDLDIKANWSRGVSEMKKLNVVLEDPKNLVPEGAKDLPRTLEVIKVVDLAGNFGSTKKFIEETTNSVLLYYQKVGQNLQKWYPKPPKVKKSSKGKDAQSEKEEIDKDEINPFWIPPSKEGN